MQLTAFLKLSPLDIILYDFITASFLNAIKWSKISQYYFRTGKKGFEPFRGGDVLIRGTLFSGVYEGERGLGQQGQDTHGRQEPASADRRFEGN